MALPPHGTAAASAQVVALQPQSSSQVHVLAAAMQHCALAVWQPLPQHPDSTRAAAVMYGVACNSASDRNVSQIAVMVTAAAAMYRAACNATIDMNVCQVAYIVTAVCKRLQHYHWQAG